MRNFLKRSSLVSILHIYFYDVIDNSEIDLRVVVYQYKCCDHDLTLASSCKSTAVLCGQ